MSFFKVLSTSDARTTKVNLAPETPDVGMLLEIRSTLGAETTKVNSTPKTPDFEMVNKALSTFDAETTKVNSTPKTPHFDDEEIRENKSLLQDTFYIGQV